MDIRLVKYFVAVVDHGGITKAARALYIAQPSLSQAIRTLERHLGCPLFDRSGRGMTLNAAGVAFVEAARRILQDVEAARTKVQNVRDRRAGRLDVATIATLAFDPLPELAGRLRRTYPDIVLNVLDAGVSADVVGEVRAGRAELGLTDLSAEPGSLTVRMLARQEIVVTLPADMAGELPDPVPLGMVADMPLVMAPGELSTRALISDVLRGGVDSIVVDCAHQPVSWELVRHGTGVTFLPRGLAEQELRDVVVRSTEPEIWREIGLVFRPGPLSPAAEAFLEIAGVSPPDMASVPVPQKPDPLATASTRRTPGRRPG